MVFFNCNACGESLKKSAVEKHYLTKCRRCECLSCVDCGKDFWGDDYQKHVKCITEEEKYSGKNYKPKPGANKGEKKQELWLEQVQEAIQKASGDKSLKQILHKLEDYPNIPRKQAKFEKFLLNSLRVTNPGLRKHVWEAMAACMNKPMPTNSNNVNTTTKSETVNGHKNGDINGPKNGSDGENKTKNCDNDEGLETEKVSKKEKKAKKHKHSTDESVSEVSTSEETESLDKKKSKREKKEERREKANKKEKKDKKSGADEVCEVKEKKSKKRKRDEEPVVEEKPVTKKSKKSDETEEAAESSEKEEVEPVAMTPSKFKWESTIVKLLRGADDKEMAVKKLKKKVVNEYFALVAEKNRMTQEEVWAKFDKKIAKNPRFKLQKERVKLTS